MAERPCALCTRPVGDARVCAHCRDLFARDLGDVDYLDEQLTIVLTRQTCYAERNGPRSSETPPVFDTRASEAGWVLGNTLTTWARIFGWRHDVIGATCWRCAHRSCSTIRADASNPGLSTWLLIHAEDIRHHEAGDECMTEIGAAVGMVRRVIDAPANRATFLVGPCPRRNQQGVFCPGEVRAYVPADPDREGRMQCTADSEHIWEPIQYTRAGLDINKRKAELKREKAA